MRSIHFAIVLLMLIATTLSAQTTLRGTVNDNHGNALPGVNLFIENSIDGTVSDSDGQFYFQSSLTGNQVLVASMIGFETIRTDIDCKQQITQKLIMRESVTSLNAVTITAGSYEASDKKRTAVLEPLDVYTTAGAVGDVTGAFRTLPGSQPAPEDGRLMVRGGEAHETHTYIDGLKASHPYDSKAPDLPTRGRFSPSLFSGVSFNTGGYSAEYGQALSSVMLLNTTDLEDESSTGFSLMTLGTELTHTMVGQNQSFTGTVNYYNMGAYQKMSSSRMHWIQPSESGGTSLMYRHKTHRGLLKAYTNASMGRMQFAIPTDNNTPATGINNQTGNIYSNVSLRESLSPKVSYATGITTTYDRNHIDINTMQVKTNDFDLEGRFKLIAELSESVKIITGISDSYNRYRQDYRNPLVVNEWQGKVDQHIAALFVESEYRPFAKLAFRPGMRGEYSTLLNQWMVAPRMSAAYKTGKKSQLSVAYGEFFQTPENDYLKFNTSLLPENATHWIASFQAGDNSSRLLRMELYRKEYNNLVCYTPSQMTEAMGYNNSGHGYAQGMDLFYRDKQTVKHLDCWVSYSYIDTRRLYKNFPTEAQPSFIANHTVSVVSKYFVVSLNSQISATYTHASGKPYHNPAESGFMNANTPYYSDLSLSWSYITHIAGQSAIFYVSVSNVLGRNNIYGYRTNDYSTDAPDQPVAIMPDQKRFVFLGLFINLL
jgi:hypothetical protein